MISPTAISAETVFFEDVCLNFDKAAIYTDFSAGLLRQIRQCNSIYRARRLFLKQSIILVILTRAWAFFPDSACQTFSHNDSYLYQIE
jgi:hypothetical protein